MAHAATFAEMLDAHLGCTKVPPAPAREWCDRPVTAPLFAFGLPPAPARPAPAPVKREPALPARLTPHERRTLDDAGTLDVLRRAYRDLARRYHPDRHHGCGAADRERLARLFAEATDHYRQLARRFSAPL